jgi:uncharacterized protein YdeI (YjbR/CyaY-like superfamily)
VKITYFKSPALFRAWLERHAGHESELWVGFHKKHTSTPSLTWPESVDEALCHGWIDGIRKSIDDSRYMIRFTPRKPTSTWSAINIKRVGVLKKLGRMTPAGLKAFAARRANRSGIYAYEQSPAELPPAFARIFKRNAAAWKYFQQQPAWYRQVVTWRIVSAKQEATRVRRLEQLIADSAAKRWVREYAAWRAPKKTAKESGN